MLAKSRIEWEWGLMERIETTEGNCRTAQARGRTTTEYHAARGLDYDRGGGTLERTDTRRDSSGDLGELSVEGMGLMRGHALQKRAKGADQTEKGTTAKTNLTAGHSQQKRRDEKTDEELDGGNDSQQTRRAEELGGNDSQQTRRRDECRNLVTRMTANRRDETRRRDGIGHAIGYD